LPFHLLFIGAEVPTNAPILVATKTTAEAAMIMRRFRDFACLLIYLAIACERVTFIYILCSSWFYCVSWPHRVNQIMQILEHVNIYFPCTALMGFALGITVHFLMRELATKFFFSFPPLHLLTLARLHGMSNGDKKT
jgi:hypothetical protein